MNPLLRNITIPIERDSFVEKITGDYEFSGHVVAKFTKLDGAVRYVVENKDGILHIFSEKNLKLKDYAKKETSSVS